MDFYKRILDLKTESLKKSIFLFGPRQTGKTWLLKKTFPDSPFYNLLFADVFLRLSQRPQLLREELLAQKEKPRQPIIIDEIQKLPVLLDEVQAMIEDHRLKFILTGSSARKLKRGGGNLLGGRAWTRHLHPLVSHEIPGFNLLRALNFGTIPSIYNSEEPEKDLAAYIGNYLKEEIQAEALVRKIENFSRFLQTVSLSNAEIVNFSNLGNDAGVPPRTVSEYFDILQDTLVGNLLQPFAKTKKRKAISTAKFYFFDMGACNFLAGRKHITPKTELFGKTFEHLIHNEIRAYLDYKGDDRLLSFWRTQQGQEVDFLIGDTIAIEVKGTSMAYEKHALGLKTLASEIPLKKKIIVSMDTSPRKMGDILILPVKTFLEELWGDGFE